MNLIKQRTDKDCLLTAFAMVTGLSYDQIESKLKKKEFYHPQEIIEHLYFEHNIITTSIVDNYLYEGEPVSCFTEDKYTHILKETDCVIGLKRGHAVAWSCAEQKVYDPTKGVRSKINFNEIQIIFIIRGGDANNGIRTTSN